MLYLTAPLKLAVTPTNLKVLNASILINYLRAPQSKTETVFKYKATYN